MQIIKEKQDVTLHLQEVRSTQGLGKKHKKAHSSMLWRYQNLLVIICGGLCSPLCSCQHPQASLSLCWAPSSGPYKGIWGREGGRDGVRCFSLPVCSFSDRLTPHSLPCSDLGRWLLAPRPQSPLLQIGDDNCPPAVQQTLYTQLYGSREQRHKPEW